MPRNSSGSYTLPSGNPVVSNTVIESGNWGNPTMADLASAMTDSLSRSGSGTMLAAMKLIDGTASLPGVTFNAESGSGMYRFASHDIRFSVSGVDQIRMTDTGVTFPLGITSAMKVTDGTEALPAYSFTSSTALGLYRPAVNILGVSSAGVERLRVDDTGRILINTKTASLGTAVLQVNGVTGMTTGSPLSGIFGAGSSTDVFTTDTDKVIHNYGLTWKVFSTQPGGAQAVLTGFGGVRFYTNGTLAGYIDLSGNNIATGRVYAGADTAAAPGHSWASDTGLGIYRPAAGVLGFVTGGAEKARLLGGADAQLLLGKTSSTSVAAGRALIDMGGATDSLLVMSAAGSPVGFLLGSASAMTLDAEGAGRSLVFNTNGAERARLTGSAQSELLVGTPTTANSSAGRGVVEVNGSSASLVGLDIAGVNKGYLYAFSTALNLQTTSGITLAIGTGGANSITIDTAQVASYAGFEIGFRGLPVSATPTTPYTAVNADKGKLVILNAAGASITFNNNIFSQGDVVTVYNNYAGGANTIVQGAGVTLRWGAALTGNRQLAYNGLATIWWITGGVGVITGTGLS